MRLATFNVENLFTRWRFNADVDPAEANTSGWTVDRTHFEEFGDTSKALTAMALLELRADVIALQEVENVDTLKHFRARFLNEHAEYPYVAGIDGNDPRLIDVAVLSKFPITHVRSYQHRIDPHTKGALFSRDCLEVDVLVPSGTTVTLFVQHFKSMIGGRAATHDKRKVQADEVMRIVKDRFGSTPGSQPFVVLGDFNDYLSPTGSAITDLVGWNQVENVVARLPRAEQWTHFFAGGNEYRQLDHFLPSASLAAASPALPEILRKGQPLRAVEYTGPRFPGVGQDRPKASDHCPVVVDLDVA
jgi:endonuclease/exonuclease/phosphatase family metal-dependent hydrolase